MDIADRSELRLLLRQAYPEASNGTVGAYLGQIWIFAKSMQPGDWVGLPNKAKRVVHFGEITGPYEFDGEQEPRLRHHRSVTWFAPNILRSKIPQDIPTDRPTLDQLIGTMQTVFSDVLYVAVRIVRQIPDGTDQRHAWNLISTVARAFINDSTGSDDRRADRDKHLFQQRQPNGRRPQPLEHRAAVDRGFMDFLLTSDYIRRRMAMAI